MHAGADQAGDVVLANLSCAILCAIPKAGKDQQLKKETEELKPCK